MVVASSRALVQSLFSFSFFFRNINRVGVGQEIFAQQNILLSNQIHIVVIEFSIFILLLLPDAVVAAAAQIVLVVIQFDNDNIDVI